MRAPNANYAVDGIAHAARRYLWTLLIGPKPEGRYSSGRRFFTYPCMTGFRPELEFYEEPLRLSDPPLPLVRVVIGKIDNLTRLVHVLRGVELVRDKTWDGATWVRSAVEAIQRNAIALTTSILDWDTVKGETLNYLHYKEGQHRFDGGESFDTSKSPTYDLLLRAELIT
jgi:hypothetical protein